MGYSVRRRRNGPDQGGGEAVQVDPGVGPIASTHLDYMWMLDRHEYTLHNRYLFAAFFLDG